MIRTTDTILGAPRGDAATAIAYARGHGAAQVDFVAEYITEVYRLAPLVGIDPVIVLAQSLQETTDAGTPWSSFWWRERLNPAGIGITGDPAQDAVSPTFANGTDAARGHLAHLLVYAVGPTVAALRWKRVVGGDIAEVDSRYWAYFDAYGDTAQATTIADLAGKWATDPDYATGIVARGNAAFTVPDQGGTTPVPKLNMTKGLIHLPDHDEDYINVAARDQSRDCRGYDNLGYRPDVPKFLVLHKSQCPPSASNSGYFHESCCPALTDWEVVAATGEFRRFVKRGDAPSGWANGVVSAPYGDALAWLNQHGFDTDTVNRDGEAIEITGYFPSAPVTQDTPVSERAWANIAQWMASRAHDYGITYETFPIIPAEGNRSYLTWHQEWTIGTGKTCPGPVVMNYTNTLVERARAIMMEAQTNTGEQPSPPPPPPKYADTLELPWFDQDLERGYPTDHVWDSEEFGRVHVFAALRPYQSIREANRLRGPNIKSGRVGPRLKVRESFRGPYTMTVDGRTFVLTYGRSFVDAGTLTPRVSVRPR